MRFDSRVRKHNASIIPPELQRKALQSLCAADHDLLTSLDRASKDDLIHSWVSREVGSKLTRSSDNVDYPRRENLVHNLHEPKSRKWSKRRWLDHDCAARSNRRHDMPHGNHHGPVPWCDRSDHSHRST